MGIGALLFFIGGCCSGGVRIETDPRVWLYILGIAIPATAVSNMALVKAIQEHRPHDDLDPRRHGALYGPVVIGILVFAEPSPDRAWRESC